MAVWTMRGLTTQWVWRLSMLMHKIKHLARSVCWMQKVSKTETMATYWCGTILWATDTLVQGAHMFNPVTYYMCVAYQVPVIQWMSLSFMFQCYSFYTCIANLIDGIKWFGRLLHFVVGLFTACLTVNAQWRHILKISLELNPQCD